MDAKEHLKLPGSGCPDGQRIPPRGGQTSGQRLNPRTKMSVDSENSNAKHPKHFLALFPFLQDIDCLYYPIKL